MKPALVVLIGVLLAAPQQQPPVFRGGVNIVTLDVTAVDKNGRPVRGLTASDFVVTLEGQPRPVQTVDFIEFGSGASRTEVIPASAAPTATVPVASKTPAHEARVVVLLFDDLSLKPGYSKGLSVAAERMLGQFGPDDLIGVTNTSGLVPPVNPTTNRGVVLAAVKKLVGAADYNPTAPFYISAVEAAAIEAGFPRQLALQAGVRECGIVQIGPGCASLVAAAGRRYSGELRYRTASQVEAFRQIMSALKTFRGAKVVITMSHGLATAPDLAALPKQLDAIMREAAESGVRFYALAEEPEYSDASDPGRALRPPMKSRTQAKIEEARALFDGLASVAIAAGGEAFHVIGQADRFFKRIEAETSAIYRLGIDAPVGADKTRFLDAKVKVNRPGVTVRANRKVLSANAAPEPITVDQRLRNALSAGGTDVAVPVSVATELLSDDKTSERRLGVTVRVPSDVAGPVIVMFSLVDDTGKSVQAGRKELSKPATGQDHSFHFALPLTGPGQYQLRVAAADANGRIGRAEQIVVVPRS